MLLNYILITNGACFTDARAPALRVWYICQFVNHRAAMLQKLHTRKIVYECLSEFSVMVPRILRGRVYFALFFLSRRKLISVYWWK